jgi:hypothetical protein
MALALRGPVQHAQQSKFAADGLARAGVPEHADEAVADD